VPHLPTGDNAPATGENAPATGDDVSLVTVTGPLTEAQAASVLPLAEAATERDSVGPLSEHALLHLRYGGDAQARNLLLTAGPVLAGPVLAGYAHLDPGDPEEGPAAELVIHPDYRGRGLGLTLARALLAEAAPQPLRVWAHGDLPAAGALADRAGFTRIRSLWTMQRPLAAPLPDPVVPAGVTLRTFSVGGDEAAWLDLNRKAFASHPEQGAWTAEDLSLRERESWFDPAGFFLAERSGKLAGFHWTKVHTRAANENPAGLSHESRGQESIGEVYVVGVDPAEQGSGLGRALTLAGLHYLRSRGLGSVMLYVDEDNTPGIRLYQSLGFTHQGTDVMFQHPAGELSLQVNRASQP
jgi:mycothiol synthase